MLNLWLTRSTRNSKVVFDNNWSRLFRSTTSILVSGNNTEDILVIFDQAFDRTVCLTAVIINSSPNKTRSLALFNYVSLNLGASSLYWWLPLKTYTFFGNTVNFELVDNSGSVKNIDLARNGSSTIVVGNRASVLSGMLQFRVLDKELRSVRTVDNFDEIAFTKIIISMRPKNSWNRFTADPSSNKDILSGSDCNSIKESLVHLD